MLSQNIVLALQSVLCLRQEVKQHCGINYKEIRRKEKPLVFSPLAVVSGTSFSVPLPTPQNYEAISSSCR